MRWFLLVLIIFVMMFPAAGEEFVPVDAPPVDEERAIALSEEYLFREYGWHPVEQRVMRQRVQWYNPVWSIYYELNYGLGNDDFHLLINGYTGECFPIGVDQEAIDDGWRNYRTVVYDEFDKDFYRHPEEKDWDGSGDEYEYFRDLPYVEPEDFVFIQQEAARIRDILSAWEEQRLALGDPRFWSIEDKAAFYARYGVNADSPYLAHLLHYEGEMIHQALGEARAYGLPEGEDCPYDEALASATEGLSTRLGLDRGLLSGLEVNAAFLTDLDFAGRDRFYRFSFHVPLNAGAGEEIYTAWVTADTGEAVFLAGGEESWAKEWYFGAMAYLEDGPRLP